MALISTNGKIRYGEFLAAAMDTNKVLEKNSLRIAFNKLDKDNSVHKCFEFDSNCRESIWRRRYQKSLKEFDIKANGVIDFEEFLALMDAKDVRAAKRKYIQLRMYVDP